MGRAQCSEKKALRKGAWSPEEDKKLIAYIKRYGIWNWSEMAKPAGLLRSGKSCRLRWVNYLKPGVKRGNYTREEEETILKMQEMLGNKWSAIAAALPGRTDNEIKNHWHTHLKNLKERQKIPDSEDNQKSSPELPNAPEASSTSDGSRKLPLSPITSPAIGIIENQNIEAHISSETLGEPSSLWGQLPLSVENLYMQSLWSPEPISTYGFYNDAINDLWFNLPVPADNIAGVKESNVHF